MPNQVKDLTSDQLRRIFRDYLIGRPKEKLIKKYDISEEVFWEIVGLYSRKKHPNDVGNAKDIEGPADLLVSPLDTGSTATENPIIARNPEDLAVTREQVVKEFDYDSPEEELRKKGGEVNDLVRDRTAKEEKKRQDEAREVIADNKEATDAILEELTQASEEGKAAIAERSIEAAKATPSPEEVLKERNAQQEDVAKAEREAQALREKSLTDQLKETQDAQQESARRETEARERANKLPKPDSTSASGGQPNVSGSSGPSAGSNPGAPSEAGTQSGGAVNPANTSPTANPPVEPAKIEPDGLKEK